MDTIAERQRDNCLEEMGFKDCQKDCGEYWHCEIQEELCMEFNGVTQCEDCSDFCGCKGCEEEEEE